MAIRPAGQAAGRTFAWQVSSYGTGDEGVGVECRVVGEACDIGAVGVHEIYVDVALVLPLGATNDRDYPVRCVSRAGIADPRIRPWRFKEPSAGRTHT